MTTHRALGRGLNALIPETPALLVEEGVASEMRTVRLRVDQIRPNPYQPRSHFNPEKLQELVDSVRERGMLQPVIVRPTREGYELVTGERRLRAAKALGWSEVPALVRPTTNREALELSLLENIQRDDLNPVEEAQAFERLATEFGLTQEAIAKATGKQRSSIANALRLLKLPAPILAALRAGTITAGHAKALLTVEDARAQRALFDRMLAEDFSVRRAETVTRHTGHRTGRRLRHTDPEIRALEEQLQHALGTKVTIQHAKKRGRILLEYYSHEDLQRLADLLRLRRSS